MRRRIFVTILAVAVATVVLFGVPLAIAIDRRNQADAELELERFADTAISPLPDDVTAGAVRLPVVEPEVHLGLYDTTGRLVTGTGPPSADRIVLAASDGDAHDGVVGDELVVAIPLIRNDRVVGAVRSSEATDEASDRTHHTWLAMTGLAAFVAVIAAAAALLLARHLTRPLGRLRDAAVRLGEGDFTVSAPPSGVAEFDAAGTALTATARRLGDLVERERAFTADASHQLRTPLTSLRLALENELAQPDADPTLALQDALVDVDRLEATLTALLALARDTVSDRRIADLGVLLHQREPQWRAGLAATGRSLSIDIDDETPRVQLSATALLTVLDVLVDNALRHGRGAVSIRAMPAPAGGARVLVADQGRLRTDLHTMFERRSATAAGHGIGLALARSLAQAEGAMLRVAQADPTTFEILIAVTVVDPSADDEPVPSPS